MCVQVSKQCAKDSLIVQPKDRNHTWNLDSPDRGDETCSSEQNRGDLFSLLCENDEQDDGDDTDDVNAHAIEAFLENERHAAEEGNNCRTESELKPEIGMQFKT